MDPILHDIRCPCGSRRYMQVFAGMAVGECTISLDDRINEAGIPDGFNIGSGDDLVFSVCADCGRMRGTWPIPTNLTPERTGYPSSDDEMPPLETNNAATDDDMPGLEPISPRLSPEPSPDPILVDQTFYNDMVWRTFHGVEKIEVNGLAEPPTLATQSPRPSPEPLQLCRALDIMWHECKWGKPHEDKTEAWRALHGAEKIEVNGLAEPPPPAFLIHPYPPALAPIPDSPPPSPRPPSPRPPSPPPPCGPMCVPPCRPICTPPPCHPCPPVRRAPCPAARFGPCPLPQCPLPQCPLPQCPPMRLEPCPPRREPGILPRGPCYPGRPLNVGNNQKFDDVVRAIDFAAMYPNVLREQHPIRLTRYTGLGTVADVPDLIDDDVPFTDTEEDLGGSVFENDEKQLREILNKTGTLTYYNPAREVDNVLDDTTAREVKQPPDPQRPGALMFTKKKYNLADAATPQPVAKTDPPGPPPIPRVVIPALIVQQTQTHLVAPIPQANINPTEVKVADVKDTMVLMGPHISVTDIQDPIDITLRKGPRLQTELNPLPRIDHVDTQWRRHRLVQLQQRMNWDDQVTRVLRDTAIDYQAPVNKEEVTDIDDLD